MDQIQTTLRVEDSVIFTKKLAVWAASSIFALEFLISIRQARLNILQEREIASKENGSPHPQELQDIRLAKVKLSFRNSNAAIFMFLVILFMKFDLAPWLWAFVGNFQAEFLPYFTNESWRSGLFVFACGGIYFGLKSWDFSFRRVIMKEDVDKTFASRWNSTLRLHEVARGNAMPTALLFMTVVVLCSQAFGLTFADHYLVFAAQVSFIAGYPIAIRPKQKHLSLMEPGTLNDSLTDMSLTFCSTFAQKNNLKPKQTPKMKLENIYISDGPMAKDIEDGVQTFGWWPRTKSLVIHRSVLEQCTSEDIMALTANQLGCWMYANNLREFCVAQMILCHALTMIILFIRQKVSYTQFGFPEDVYPSVAGLLVFAIGFAPIFWLYFTLQMNFNTRRNAFLADKFAADLGYSSELSATLTKIPRAACETKIDWLYSWYHNGNPQISERLEALEKLVEKEEGKISLPATINEKV